MTVKTVLPLTVVKKNVFKNVDIVQKLYKRNIEKFRKTSPSTRPPSPHLSPHSSLQSPLTPSRNPVAEKNKPAN